MLDVLFVCWPFILVVLHFCMKQIYCVLVVQLCWLYWAIYAGCAGYDGHLLCASYAGHIYAGSCMKRVPIFAGMLINFRFGRNRALLV